MKKQTKEEFIEKAKKVHGDKYDYSKVEYVNTQTKVCIICPEHGEFWQNPDGHLVGRGCPECGKIKSAKGRVLNNSKFIEKARKIHGGKYDYSKVEYKNNRTKVCIICPEHGEFWQTPNAHLNGKGCPKCGIINTITKKNFNKERFIEKARKVHGDRYDYSKVNYINSHTNVCIICPDHGEFWQTPNSHLSGCNCPQCNKYKLKTFEDFVNKARKIHGEKYEYNKDTFINTQKKTLIHCNTCGHNFWQKPGNHVNGKGNGCPKCSKKQAVEKTKLKFEDLLERAKEIHGDKYDYQDFIYKDVLTKGIIKCKTCNRTFEQNMSEHVSQRHGCPYCAKQRLFKSRVLTTDEFIKKAIQVHSGYYSYDKSDYVNYETPIIITCPKHGDFLQIPGSHLQGKGCCKCANSLSRPENEIYEYCCSLIGEDNVIQRDRIIIGPQELDIYIPFLKIGIEYNGLVWHSEKYKSKIYHLDKLNKCKERGIKLIQIFEDEYLNNKDIVLSKIRHLMGVDNNLPKIMARKCVVKEIDYKTAKTFLDPNHIQGGSASTIYLGAFYEDKLVGVMSFKRETKNSKNWELTRFASDNSYICQGVGGKLFSYFVKNYNPEEVKSFADRRWTVDEEHNVYIQLGFKFDKYTEPDYHYYVQKDGIVRQHKFNFRKQKLHKEYGLPLSMTEDEMTKELGYYKIWDCGLIKYVWKKEK